MLEVRVVEEPVTVIVSEKGWVRARQGHGHDQALFGFKSGDAFYGAYEVMTTTSLSRSRPMAASTRSRSRICRRRAATAHR